MTDSPTMLDLFHRTSVEAAAEIRRTGRMVSRENTGEGFFSTLPNGEYADGDGDTVIHIRVEAGLAEIDDEFATSDQHYRVTCSLLEPRHFVD